MRPPPRAVFFDFDDTLFDHTHALREGLRTLRRTDPQLRRRPFPSIVREYERLLERIQPGRPGGPKTHPEARQERFRQLDSWLGGAGDPGTAERRSLAYREAYQDARRPVEGAVPLLRRLHGQLTVGVVTNNHRAEQQDKLRALDLGRWIDFMVTSEEVGVEKPDPRIFEVALREAGVGAEEATMVGDSWATDIVGATGAGLGAVWLRRRGRRPAGYPAVREIRSYLPVARTDRLLRGP